MVHGVRCVTADMEQPDEESEPRHQTENCVRALAKKGTALGRICRRQGLWVEALHAGRANRRVRWMILSFGHILHRVVLR